MVEAEEAERELPQEISRDIPADVAKLMAISRAATNFYFRTEDRLHFNTQFRGDLRIHEAIYGVVGFYEFFDAGFRCSK